MRVHTSKLVQVCSATGFKNPTPMAILPALNARVEGCTVNRVGQALLREKSLMQQLSLRQIIRIIPRHDVAVFTRALIPYDEEELLYHIRQAMNMIVALDVEAFTLLKMMETTITLVLSGKELTKEELVRALALAMQDLLTNAQKEIWRWPSELVGRETLGESLLRLLLPVFSLKGFLCVMPLKGNAQNRTIRLTHEFFGKLFPGFDDVSDANASEELVKRYLHCYGPATEESFARWAGVSDRQAQRMWEPLLETLAEVQWNDFSGWMLQEDVEQLGHSFVTDNLHLLGPHDPWLQHDNRNLLLDGKQLFRYFFKSTGPPPGMVLFDGKCVAGWHQRRQGNKLYVTIEDIGLPLGRVAVSEIEHEIWRLATAMHLRSGGFSLKHV
ncbi:MAG: crosslink repair DNA glycosylase YcaQ family protein [Sphaerochaetaceae bacterium]|nr:crosslink repair DNA glycosylase YcaQ family protein [Sphaerochaetaceae bacterium]